MAYFSVIIPLFNKQATIASTLKSVLCQDFTDFEVIIINDGSTDNSEQEVLKFTDDRIKYFKTKNNGVSSARNFGIENAIADYIAFLDADDYWFENHLNALLKMTQSFPEVGLYATNYEIKFSNNKTINNTFTSLKSDTEAAIVADFFGSSLQSRIALTSALAVQKNVFNQLGGFNTTINFGEDLELWILFALRSKVAFDPKISVSYNANAQNRLSDLQVSKRNFAKLNQFTTEEQENLNLKNFLNIYRAEFAIKYKLAYNFKMFMFYYNQISVNNLNWKTKLILKLPTSIVKIMYLVKKKMEQNNISISIYH